MTRPVSVFSPVGREIIFGNSDRLAVIAGPCVVESEPLLRTVAERLLEIQSSLPVDFIFKSSYRKANRTSSTSFTGIGDEKALTLLAKIRADYDLPILSDVHDALEIASASQVIDIIQIPAFLSRQTELLQAAGKTGKIVEVKKGQFMSAEDMRHAKAKIEETGNNRVILAERGTFFGYGDLVVDFRSLVHMRSFGCPVIYDATHSIQRPSQNGVSGGDRRFLAPLARAAVAVGIDGLFLETHPNPAEALSDRDSQLPLDELESLLERLLAVRDSVTRTV
ncbi:MAG: 3-deoxy-8-phosphooctulonate synthase [Bacteroidota bacterium]|nr:3-deoxy-8-phosphooctulonate synthase [Bacteroidota bacterium]MDP4234587.1 3-deoxy-8-phosphooctulonate synthase [Bacteroidota bacterium]MDP4243716.1 3-deoxy-8-phosphooctulonate synthase [Bacteroidota bacterium]